MQNCNLQSTSLFPVSKSPSPPLPVSLTWLLFPFPFPLSPFPFPQQFKKSISSDPERSWLDEGKNWFPIPSLVCYWVFFRRRSGAALLCVHLCSVSSCILACFGVVDSAILHKQRSIFPGLHSCQCHFPLSLTKLLNYM